MTARAAEWLVRLAALVVPGDRREEWREEWLAELAALSAADRRAIARLPGSLTFAAGALPHALWMRLEAWTMDGLLLDLRFGTRVLRSAGVIP